MTFLKFAKENADGWSLVAVRAPLRKIAPLLQSDALVLEYQPAATLGVISKGEDGLSYDADGEMVSLTPVPGRRTCFAVQPSGSDWCILFRTVYWVQLEDIEWVQKAAQSLSSRLETTTVASSGGEHGCLCSVYEAGKEKRKLSGVDRKKIASSFDELGISLPLCFIGGNPPNLLATSKVIKSIEQADRFEMKVPAS
jgi:hypothetical protein